MIISVSMFTYGSGAATAVSVVNLSIGCSFVGSLSERRDPEKCCPARAATKRGDWASAPGFGLIGRPVCGWRRERAHVGSEVLHGIAVRAQGQHCRGSVRSIGPDHG